MGGEPLIDLGSLLKSNLAAPPGRGGVRADLSKWIRRGSPPLPAKIFPDNLLFEVELPVGYGQTTDLIGVAYDFPGNLPAMGGYQPRDAGERRGYFPIQ